MNTLNIFISSPGDVSTERMIARRVIRKLQREFIDSVKLNAILWEDLPLQATSSFQDGINAVLSSEGVDVAVFILASRLGSSPGKQFKKIDGSYYKSGTEYEFDIMRSANEKTEGKKPILLAYVKSVNNSITFHKELSTNEIQEWLEQKKAADKFIKENFYDSESNTSYRAYHQFDVPTSFEQKLSEHLRRIIIQKFGDIQRVEWFENPYVGLNSFDYGKESIFYGRQRVINDIMEQIVLKSAIKAPSVFIIGQSGSGKSSLLKAGILPDLMESDSYNLLWDKNFYTPSSFNGDTYSGIVSIIFDAFPTLSETAVWQDLKKGIIADARYLSDSFNVVSHKSTKLCNCLICIDQFEEFFTDNIISISEYNKTMKLINALVQSGKIWFFFTMRNDFYHYFSENNDLLEIRQNSFVFDLPIMFPSEIQEIIEEPARKSGTRWEIKNGVSLNKIVLNDALIYRDNLPLIEFTLSLLYDQKNDNKEMTFLAYDEMGKLDGAIIHYADSVYNSFSQEEKLIFEVILSHLIKVSSIQSDVFVRKTAIKSSLIQSSIHEKVVNTLINAHLLVSGKNANGEATIAIVHEVLINQWDAIQQWIKKELDLIKMNEYYDTQSSHWIESNKNKNELILSKKSIRASEYFMYQWGNKISNNVRDYILESIKRNMRKGLRILIAIELLVVISLGCLYISLVFFPDLLLSFKIVDIVFDESFINDLLKTLPMAIQSIAIMAYCIIKKIKAKPVYFTIKQSLVFWIVMSVLSIIDLILSFHGFVLEENDLFIFCSYLILPLFVFVKTIQKWLQYKVIIVDWRNRTIKQSRLSTISTRLAKISNIIITIFVVIIGITTFLIWGIILSEQQTAVEESNSKLLELYDGLDRISDRLTQDDIYYVNTMRWNLLIDNYEEEICEDSKGYYALEIAKSLYNIRRPDLASYYYDGDDYWFRSLIYEDLSIDSIMNNFLWNYYSNKENYILNSNFPWQAEKCGDFELAKQSSEYLDSVYHVNLDTINTYTINYAHSLLMTGNRTEALTLYQRYLHSSFPDGRLWNNEIINDFAVFKWKGFDSTNINFIEKELSLKPDKLFTTISDTTNKELIERFAGKWQCVENGLTINYELTIDNFNLAFYIFSDTLGTQMSSVTQYRLANVNDSIVIEEYESRSNTISAGYISMPSPNELNLEIIDNGNANIRGITRRYKRLIE